MPILFEDHGLPLVQLKEQRHEMTIALKQNRVPILPRHLVQLAEIQTAIAAIEAVVVDLDPEFAHSVSQTQRPLLRLVA